MKREGLGHLFALVELPAGQQADNVNELRAHGKLWLGWSATEATSGQRWPNLMSASRLVTVPVWR